MKKIYGKKSAAKELYSEIEVNGETWEIFKVIPGDKYNKASILLSSNKELFELVQKASDNVDSLTEDELTLVNTKFTGTLIEIFDLIIPEHTSEGLSKRFKGEIAPVLELTTILELAGDLIGSLNNTVAVETGKAKNG